MSTIEEILHQKKFRNIHEKTLVSLVYTAQLIQHKQQLFFKKFQLTQQQYNVLRILRSQHPNAATVNLIKERMMDRNSDASRIVERLRIAGLVQRLESETDRRSVNVLITKKGLALLERIDKLEEELFSTVKGLNLKEADQFNELLDKLLTHLNRNEK